MPSAETFSIKPIGKFVRSYLDRARISVDPFARNRDWATYTNDINPNTTAKLHLDAEMFLEFLAADGIAADLALFDPPYSPRQVSEHYKAAGIPSAGNLWEWAKSADTNLLKQCWLLMAAVTTTRFALPSGRMLPDQCTMLTTEK